MNSPQPSWTPPNAFDEYRLVRLVGAGGMGAVYLAQDTLLERAVALKFIASIRPDEAARQRFYSEARAIARLQHPNVVAVHRVGDVDGRPYLVTEFVRGKSLAEIDKPVASQQMRSIGMGLARGLAAAHREGVLHRDIKPANAMITEDSEVKLLDFGLAKILIDVSSPAHPAGPRDDDLTGIAGTPLYMAPEVLRGDPATRRSDIFSLGAVLYELLAGAPPRKEAAGWSLESLADAEPRTLDGPNIDPRLAAIVMRCLARDPELRFGSAEELADAFDLLDESRSLAEVPAGNPYRGLSPFEAEHRALFFGRDAEIEAVLDRLHVEPIVLVAGDSGVGKSSLCRAGILPRIRAEGIGDGRTYSVISLVPGRRPARALTAVAAPVLGISEEILHDAIRAQPGALAREVRRANASGAGLLIFIDQLEELFTISEENEARVFAEAIARFAVPAAGARVLMTIRGDFFTRLGSLPALGTEVSRSFFLLRPLSLEGIRAAITGPAQRTGVVFEGDELVDALVQSAMQSAGSLPLLQFAMAELWELRDRATNVVPGSALSAIGGVGGALARHADGVLEPLRPSEQQAAKRILVDLVTSRGTRVRRTAAELRAEDPDTRAALEALIRGRLIVVRDVDRQSTYEVAHEALLEGWDTLRRWLDADGERRQIRERITLAAMEWERLGRARDQFWTKRQLDEASSIADADLGSLERSFLDGSRDLIRRTRTSRVMLSLAVPIMLATVFGGMRVKAAHDLDAAVADHHERAHHAFELARARKSEASALRAKAFDLFDGAPSSLEDAEAAWTKAVDAARDADTGFVETSRALEAAFTLDPARAATRSMLSEMLLERIELAEWSHNADRKQDLENVLASYDDDGSRRRKLAAPPRLTLETSPPGAEAHVQRYQNTEGRFELSAARSLGRTPLAELDLSEGPGSYLFTFREDGRATTRLPVVLTAGENLSLRVPMPASERVPAGFVYVPEGRFLTGSTDPEAFRKGFLRAAPLHVARTPAYLISRTEVTYGEWLEFLPALPPAERKVRRPFAQSRDWGVVLDELAGGRWQLTLYLGGLPSVAREGETIRFADRDRRAVQDWTRLPVTGISLHDGEAYAAWLDRTGRVPRARLCDEREWERAGRGADARGYPGSDRLELDDANFDETYGRKSHAYGPDEVGAHPGSESPFGVVDLSGNAFEWTRPAAGSSEAWIRGGAYYYDSIGALLYNRTVTQAEVRDGFVGLRVCADIALE